MKVRYPWSWRRISVVLLVCVAVFGLGPGTWYMFTKQTGPIYEFNYDRDRQPILDIFNQNWYWLISSDDYSPEFMMKYHAPNHYDPAYVGKLQIKVLREKIQNEDTFIGFVAYYLKKPTEGQLLFLAVRPEFRGKRYGEQLINYALADLKKRGAKVVKLVTRTTNENAQKLYTRVGFKETSREDGYVYFEYHF